MNYEKAHELWRWLQANSERWFQRHWTTIPLQYWGRSLVIDPNVLKPLVKEGTGHTIDCGTSACVAGHAAFMWAPVGTQFYREHLVAPSGALWRYSSYARDALELTDTEALYLFNEYRTLDEIGAFLTGDEIQREDIIDEWIDSDEE